MTSRTGGFIRLVVGLTVGLALTMSCGEDSEPETGSARSSCRYRRQA